MFELSSISKYHILNKNCYKVLPLIPDKSVNCIFTDPPYNLNEYSTGDINLPWRSTINNEIADWDKKIILPNTLLYDFKRVLKPNGNIFIFTSYNLLGKWHDAFDKEFDTFQYFIWHKTNPTPKIYKNGFLNSCEMIICLWNKGHTWNFSKQNEMHNFFESSICMGNERIKNPKHPTQKPLKILEHLIKIGTNENDLILDPFMGVGSVGEASLKLKRKFIGCEIEKKYYTATKIRLLKYKKD